MLVSAMPVVCGNANLAHVIVTLLLINRTL